jgi:hypothetical protein
MEGKMQNLNGLKFLAAAQEALKELAAEHGVEVDVIEREDGLRVKLAQDEDAARQEFEAYSWKFGYPKQAFGQTFASQGTLYKIVGVKPTAEKNCFRIRRVKDGKEFVCGKGFVGSTQLNEWAQKAAA